MASVLALLALFSGGCTGMVLNETPLEDSGGVANPNMVSARSNGGAAGVVATLNPSEPAGAQPPVPLPANYRTWPVFLLNIQRTDNLQIRDIYINAVGATTQQGAPFAEGTVMVMDLIDVQKDGAGAAMKDANGAMIKGSLLKTYVMEKNTGWGNTVPAAQRNGDWLYSGYAKDGVTELKDSTTPCFTCHLPLGASLDWVQRYAEYFQHRSAAKP